MAGQTTLKTRGWLRQQYPQVLEFLYQQFTYLNTMLTELFTDHTVTYYIPTHASRTVYNVFTATRGFTVVGAYYVPDVAQGSAVTATVVKATGTATPASGTTPITTAGNVNMNGTAHTVQTLTLSSTPADLVLAATNRIGVVLSGALSTGAGHLTLRLKRT